MKLQELASKMKRTMGLSDLGQLCFDLGIDVNNLKGETLNDKIIALIKHFYKRKELGKLVVLLKEMRPNESWNLDVSIYKDGLGRDPITHDRSPYWGFLSIFALIVVLLFGLIFFIISREESTDVINYFNQQFNQFVTVALLPEPTIATVVPTQAVAAVVPSPEAISLEATKLVSAQISANTPVSTQTAPTDTPLPTPTDTPLPTPTDTPLPAPTDTPLPAPTDTPLPTPTLLQTNTSMIAHWQFDCETGGIDSSGNFFNGKLSGDLDAIRSDTSDNCFLDFTDESNLFEVTANEKFAPDSGQAGVWFRVSTWQNANLIYGNGLLFGIRICGDGNVHGIIKNGPDDSDDPSNPDTSWSVVKSAAPVIKIDKWHHVVIRWSESLDLFFDGEQLDSTGPLKPPGLIDSTSYLKAGGLTEGECAENFLGQIDEITFYEGITNNDVIRANYESLAGGFK